MPRLKQVPRAEVTAPRVLATYQRHFGDRDPVAQPGTVGGTPGNWWTVFALDPQLFELMLDRQEWQFSKERKIDPVLRELGIARAGWNVGSRFVFSQHCKLLRKNGGTEAQVSGIRSWATEDCYSALQRAVLAYADDLTLANGRSTDARFTALRKGLSDEAILELTFMVCTYQMSATMARALRLEWDDVDDPVAEASGGSVSR